MRHILYAILFLLTLVTPLYAVGNTCVAQATGNWSATGTWTDCGGAVPGDGDIAIINAAYTVTIDQDIGTAGNGIKNIILYHASAVLQVDNSAARTITFASTGADATGATAITNAAWTGSDATMYGFMVGKGYLNLTGTATNRVTVTTNGNYRFYIGHLSNSFGTGSNKAKLKLQYCTINRLGTTGGTGTWAVGTYWEIPDATYTVLIDNCIISTAWRVFQNAGGGTQDGITLTNNTISGVEDSTFYLLSIINNLRVQGNTETANSGTNKKFVHGAYPGSNWNIVANTVVAAAGTVKQFLLYDSASTGSGLRVTDNVLLNPKGSGTVRGIQIVNNDKTIYIAGNYIAYGFCPISWGGSGVYPAGIVERNLLVADSGSTGAQGQIFVGSASGSSGAYKTIFRNNTVIMDGTPASFQMGIFTYAETTYHVDIVNNTVVNNSGTKGSSQGIHIGEGNAGSALASRYIKVINNLVYGMDTAYYSSSPETLIIDTTYPNRVGMHHNGAFNNTNFYYDLSGAVSQGLWHSKGTATYSNATTFTINTGTYDGSLHTYLVGKRVKVLRSVGDPVYSIVASASYANPTTTVVLVDAVLDANITTVYTASGSTDGDNTQTGSNYNSIIENPKFNIGGTVLSVEAWRPTNMKYGTAGYGNTFIGALPPVSSARERTTPTYKPSRSKTNRR